MHHPSACFMKAMNDTNVFLTLAGLPVQLQLIYPIIAPLFRDFRTEPAENAIQLGLTRDEIAQAKRNYPENPSEEYVESMELCTCVSDAFLKYDRCVFHATAFLYRGKAWLLTAPSSTGKTTMYLQCKRRYGSEIKLINGDKPLLDFSQSDGRIWVHPSPWKGKENMGTLASAPLGGMILLEQGKTNQIRRLSVQEAVQPIFCQFLVSNSTEAQVQMVSRLEARLLRGIPVWKLVNRGDADAAQVCIETMKRQEDRK